MLVILFNWVWLEGKSGFPLRHVQVAYRVVTPSRPGPDRPESPTSDGCPRGRSRTPRAATSATDPATNPLRAREVLQRVNKQRLQRLLATLPEAQQAARLENASYLGRKWLDTLPTRKQLVLSDEEATEALRQRLFVPTRSPGPCSFCGAVASAIGHQDTYRGAYRAWISRHNVITRAFQNALSYRVEL